MRIALEHTAIHEGAGIAFVRIADYVFVLSGSFGDRTPLEPRGITRAATPSQTALDHLLHDFGRSHLGQNTHQGTVSGGADVFLDAFGVDQARIFKNDFLLPLEEWHICTANQATHGFAIKSVQDLARVCCRHMLIKCSLGGRDERALGAQAHATNALRLAFFLPAAVRDFLIESVFDALALTGNAARREADVHAMQELCLRSAFLFRNLLEFFRSHCGSISSDVRADRWVRLFRPHRGRKPPPEQARTSPGNALSARRLCRRQSFRRV